MIWKRRSKNVLKNQYRPINWTELTESTELWRWIGNSPSAKENALQSLRGWLQFRDQRGPRKIGTNVGGFPFQSRDGNKFLHDRIAGNVSLKFSGRIAIRRALHDGHGVRDK